MREILQIGCKLTKNGTTHAESMRTRARTSDRQRDYLRGRGAGEHGLKLQITTPGDCVTKVEVFTG